MNPEATTVDPCLQVSGIYYLCVFCLYTIVLKIEEIKLYCAVCYFVTLFDSFFNICNYSCCIIAFKDQL